MPRLHAVAFVLTLTLPLRRSLDEVEHFVKLDSLILDNNELTDSAVFPSLPGLKTLSLNNNQLQDLDKFLTQATASFNNLEFLSMLKNPACPHPLGGGDPEEYKRFRCAPKCMLQPIVPCVLTTYASECVLSIAWGRSSSLTRNL